MNKKTRALAFTLAIAAGLFSGAATADFSGPYDVSKWNGGAPYSEGVNSMEHPLLSFYSIKLCRGGNLEVRFLLLML
jgi:hypothetical protein